MDVSNTFLHLYETAKTYHADGADPHAAAREALTEAHALLSQEQFFALVDHYGGHAAMLERLTAALEDPQA